MPHKIVFVEDDAELAALIAGYLERHDFEVVIEPRGDTALQRIAHEAPDLVLLDIMLPGKDGLTLCRELRPLFDRPIIMLTSLDSDMNQILSLEIGANDFILKTTQPAVLLARLRSQLRRTAASHAASSAAHGERTQLVLGALTIDARGREVSRNGQRIQLSTADFDLLWLLAGHAGTILSRDAILQAMRGVSYDGLDRSIDIAVSRLRKKLGDDPNEPTLIKTVRNKGYLLVPTGW